ncbi:MAG TPA: CDP-alcohol phosphatidyltransferase family protein [Bacteroidetes bacterium]|nr:CDP-alcohol phosphatidyltransferase family protein [Bacteroidota bacterium]
MKTSAIILNTAHPSATTKVYGLLVLERTFHALERAGVEAVLLPGAEEERLQEVIGRNDGWKIKFRFVDHFRSAIAEQKNGILVLAAPLVLDQKIPEKLMEEGAGKTDVLVDDKGLIAYFPQAFLQKIKSIPKELNGWLEKAEIEDFKIKSLDFQGLVCNTVFSEAEKKSVMKALIRSLTKPTDGWVSRNLNRPVSTLFSRVLAHTPVTPNQFTVVAGLLGLATGVFFALGGYWNYLIGGALFHFTSIMDGVDGELARLKYKSSPFGQWLDTLVDNLSYLAALAGIITGIFRNGASEPVKIAGILAVVFAVLALGSLYLYLLRFKSGGTLLNVEYSFQGGDGFFDKFMQVAAAFGKRDLFALIFFGLGIIGQMPMALGYVAIMAFFVFAFSIQAHFAAAKKRRGVE